MKSKSILLAGFLLVLNNPLSAATEAGIQVIARNWEKGITEIGLKSRYPIQSSGSFGESIIWARFEGVVQKVTEANGKLADILKNEVGTIVGFNVKPATEVNQIYIVVKANSGLHIFENLSLLLVDQLAPRQRGFTKEDRDYFYLTGIDGNRLLVQFRGQKMVNPPIRPFSFQIEVSPSGALKFLRDSVVKL